MSETPDKPMFSMCWHGFTVPQYSAMSFFELMGRLPCGLIFKDAAWWHAGTQQSVPMPPSYTRRYPKPARAFPGRFCDILISTLSTERRAMRSEKFHSLRVSPEAGGIGFLWIASHAVDFHS